MRKKIKPSKNDVVDELFLDIERLEADMEADVQVIRKRLKIIKGILDKLGNTRKGV